MKFWDSSALVTLLVEEAHSRACRDLYRDDSKIVTWQFTKTEIVSALYKFARREILPLGQHQLDTALRRLDLIARQWIAVTALDLDAIEDMHRRAASIMSKYALQSGDGLQLAAAMTYFAPVHRRGFVVVDRGLAHAAKAEGFTVYPRRPSRRSPRPRS